MGVLVILRAHDLPGRTWDRYGDIHVALQVGTAPQDPVAADLAAATWQTDVTVTPDDFRGQAVQGKRGDRFLYLTWGELHEGSFTMFRRAKLMLADLGPGVATAAHAIGTLGLTDARGGPLCGRVVPPTITWALS